MVLRSPDFVRMAASYVLPKYGDWPVCIAICRWFLNTSKLPVERFSDSII